MKEDFEEAVRTAVATRPVIPLRPAQSPPQRHDPFGSIQEAQRALVSAQERLDELAKRLVGEPPRFVAPESPSVSTAGGLLAVTGLCARNMRARAEHMALVLEMIEESMA